MNIKILRANLHRSWAADNLCRYKGGIRWYGDALGTAVIWISDGNGVIVEEHDARGCCYFSQNEPLPDLQMKLSHLKDQLRGTEGPAIAGRDINAKVVEWDFSQGRGRYMLTIAVRLCLNVANVGNTITFRRSGYGESIPGMSLV